VGGQRHAPVALPPGKRPGTHFYRRLCGPQCHYGRLRKIWLPPGLSIPQNVAIMTTLSRPPILVLYFHRCNFQGVHKSLATGRCGDKIFVQFDLVFPYPLMHGTWFETLFWRLEFWDGSYIFGKNCGPLAVFSKWLLPLRFQLYDIHQFATSRNVLVDYRAVIRVSIILDVS